MDNASLQDLSKMAKEIRGTSDVSTDVSSNITAVRWKDNNVNGLFTFTGKEQIQSVKRFCKKQDQRVDIEQPNIVNIYNKSMGGVDPMDQNIVAYMINLQSKKCWWPLLRFVLDQLYRMRSLNQGEKRLDALGLRKVIVGAYFRKFRKSITNTTLHPGNRLL